MWMYSNSKKVAALEAEVSKLRENYELLATNIAAAVLIYDPKFTITFVSPYTEVLTGYALEEILAGKVTIDPDHTEDLQD